MKLRDVFEKSVQFFKEKKIETARLDAELLLAHALKFDRLQIYLKYEQPLSETEVTACREAIRRRAQGEPVAYILGERGFYGEMFKVGSGVLIPRPETEMLVEEALDFIKLKNLQEPQILDLGAGTGCIGFSILKNCDGARLTSVEKSSQAFEYLKLNQEKLGLGGRSELILKDVCEITFEQSRFDVIVANPPYIAAADVQVEENVRKYEPQSALFADDEGCRDLYQWSERAHHWLKPGGLMLFEMGHTQGEKLKKHFERLGGFSDVYILKDLSGLDRAVKALNNKDSF